MSLIQVGESDDPYFIELANNVVNQLLESHSPNEVWIIQIDNWFDHKWLGFSGIGVVDFPWSAHGIGELGALDEFHQDRLTFPPFVPNRVLGQWSYVRTEIGYKETPLRSVPHSTDRQLSEKNLRRFVQDFTSSGVFVWYSSNTVANGRGSLMVYTAANSKVDAWFAAFVRDERWQLRSTKGVSRERLQQMIETGFQG